MLSWEGIDPSEWLAWVLLALGILAAAATFNAFVPLKRTPLILWSFLSGWLTNELAIHQLVWQTAAAGVLVWFGGLDSWPAMAGLTLIVLSDIGLVWLTVIALRTTSVMTAALHDALGQDFENHIDPELRRRERWTGWRQLFFPLFLLDRRVTTTRGIDYGAPRGRLHRLDIHRPRDAVVGAPVLVWIHGGGWVSGTKGSQGLPLMTGLAARGWICVAPNYRLSPKATFPDHLVDVKEAIAWVKTHIGNYGGDPNFVVVSGGSAGGHLASLVALTHDPEYQPGFETADTSVLGCVSLYGVYDFTNRAGQYRGRELTRLISWFVMKQPLDDTSRSAYEAASPTSRVHRDAPPFLVIASGKDSLVPVADSTVFVAALRAVSTQPVTHVVLPGAQHSFEVFHSIRTAAALAGIERWLDWLRTVNRAHVIPSGSDVTEHAP